MESNKAQSSPNFICGLYGWSRLNWKTVESTDAILLFCCTISTWELSTNNDVYIYDLVDWIFDSRHPTEGDIYTLYSWQYVHQHLILRMYMGLYGTVHFLCYRVLYQQADVYIFDDPLSAVDAKVAHNLFNEWVVTQSVIFVYVMHMYILPYLSKLYIYIPKMLFEIDIHMNSWRIGKCIWPPHV